VNGVHLYCLLPSDMPPATGASGIAGATVEAVYCDSLACWITRHDARPPATVDSVRAHNAVVMAAMSPRVTPVPLRFGQWLPDAAAVCGSIGKDAPHWLDLLHRFAGHAEYGVRIARAGHEDEPHTARDVHPGREHTGKEYMALLARRHAATAEWKAAAARIAADLLAITDAAVSDSRIELPARVDEMVSLALLIPAARAAHYSAALDRFRSQRQDLRFLCTGPWPPYSFVA
jgi:hypothetical protein